MSPVSPVFHTEVTVRIGLKNSIRMEHPSIDWYIAVSKITRGILYVYFFQTRQCIYRSIVIASYFRCTEECEFAMSHNELTKKLLTWNKKLSCRIETCRTFFSGTILVDLSFETVETERVLVMLKRKRSKNKTPTLFKVSINRWDRVDKNFITENYTQYR